MIREMTDHDKEEVLLLSASQSHEDHRHTGRDRPHEELLSEWRERGLITKYDGEIVYLVEERDNEIIGYCSMSITTDGMSQMGEVSGLYVTPEHRKQGIALGLLERIGRPARRFDFQRAQSALAPLAPPMVHRDMVRDGAQPGSKRTAALEGGEPPVNHEEHILHSIEAQTRHCRSRGG